MRKPTWASELPSCLGSVVCVTSQDTRAAGNTVRLSPAACPTHSAVRMLGSPQARPNRPGSKTARKRASMWPSQDYSPHRRCRGPQGLPPEAGQRWPRRAPAAAAAGRGAAASCGLTGAPLQLRSFSSLLAALTPVFCGRGSLWSPGIFLAQPAAGVLYTYLCKACTPSSLTLKQ